MNFEACFFTLMFEVVCMGWQPQAGRFDPYLPVQKRIAVKSPRTVQTLDILMQVYKRMGTPGSIDDELFSGADRSVRK